MVQSQPLCFYSNYVEWCNENALTAVDKEKCKEHVLSFAPSIYHKKVGPRQKRVWGFKGLRLKTVEELNSSDNDSEVK